MRRKFYLYVERTTHASTQKKHHTVYEFLCYFYFCIESFFDYKFMYRHVFEYMVEFVEWYLEV